MHFLTKSAFAIMCKKTFYFFQKPLDKHSPFMYNSSVANAVVAELAYALV